MNPSGREALPAAPDAPGSGSVTSCEWISVRSSLAGRASRRRLVPGASFVDRPPRPARRRRDRRRCAPRSASWPSSRRHLPARGRGWGPRKPAERRCGSSPARSGARDLALGLGALIALREGERVRGWVEAGGSPTRGPLATLAAFQGLPRRGRWAVLASTDRRRPQQPSSSRRAVDAALDARAGARVERAQRERDRWAGGRRAGRRAPGSSQRSSSTGASRRWATELVVLAPPRRASTVVAESTPCSSSPINRLACSSVAGVGDPRADAPSPGGCSRRSRPGRRSGPRPGRGPARP